VTIWSDAHRPEDLDIPAINGDLGLGTSNAPASAGLLETFVAVLGSSHKFFALSYGTSTIEFDTTHLPAARERFFDACAAPPPRSK
jgi:hypothetical protein